MLLLMKSEISYRIWITLILSVFSNFCNQNNEPVSTTIDLHEKKKASKKLLKFTE